MPENEPQNISTNTDTSIASTSLLLVDDDPLILEGLGFMLRKQYKMIAADSRPQALEKVHQADELPSLALIDLGLPPYPHKPDEGFALIRELLSLQPNMKVLVLSGQDNDVNIQHALTIGAVDFIAKPADPDLLLARLQHHQRLHEIDQRRDAQKTVSIIGDSIAMQMVNDQISQFADSPFPVLIEGPLERVKSLSPGRCMKTVYAVQSLTWLSTVQRLHQICLKHSYLAMLKVLLPGRRKNIRGSSLKQAKAPCCLMRSVNCP